MALTIEHEKGIHILGIIAMVIAVLMPVNSTAELSKEGAISWFNDQEIIAKVEGGTGLLRLLSEPLCKVNVALSKKVPKGVALFTVDSHMEKFGWQHDHRL